MADKELGRVTHYFDKAMVAVIKLSAPLSAGDNIKFVHGEHEFTQVVGSIEINHEKVESCKAGQEVAIKLDEKTHEGAKVYKVE
jgi:GTPase